jgi:hypothetical protein
VPICLRITFSYLHNTRQGPSGHTAEYIYSLALHRKSLPITALGHWTCQAVQAGLWTYLSPHLWMEKSPQSVLQCPIWGAAHITFLTFCCGSIVTSLRVVVRRLEMRLWLNNQVSRCIIITMKQKEKGLCVQLTFFLHDMVHLFSPIPGNSDHLK